MYARGEASGRHEQQLKYGVYHTRRSPAGGARKKKRGRNRRSLDKGASYPPHKRCLTRRQPRTCARSAAPQLSLFFTESEPIDVLGRTDGQSNQPSTPQQPLLNIHELLLLLLLLLLGAVTSIFETHPKADINNKKTQISARYCRSRSEHPKFLRCKLERFVRHRKGRNI